MPGTVPSSSSQPFRLMLRSTLGKAKILIVDDEQANVRLLERILELIGATHVRSTTDSREALAHFIDFRPDLVLLDLHMPNVTGFDILEQLKTLGGGENHVPVLVLTADVTNKTKHHALRLGAKDYLTKPLDQAEVLLRIRNLLENRFLQIGMQNQNILLEEQVAERTTQLEDTLSKLRTAQQTAIRQERLSALGTMAAGIAHDFNNALTLILGYSDLLLAGAKSRAVETEITQLHAITTAAQDAAQIVRRLREFHRPDEGMETRVVLQLNALIEQAVSLTRPKWQEQVRHRGVEVDIRTELKELPPMQGDPAELREMLTNLIFNAVDAMPMGGVITVRTKLDDGEAQLCVADTGTGMDEETRRRCLEPFFTTKGERGSGLGLSAVYGIIERHGGAMEIESEKGKGTTFIIRLPVAEVEDGVEVVPTVNGAAEAEARDASGIRRILVVDDQEIIRDVIQQQLAEDGHEVQTAGSGREALELLGALNYDLLVTDHSMPGMTGEELAVQVKGKFPKTAVILLTGFGGSVNDNARAMPGVDMILGKPASSFELRRAIVQVTQ